MMFSNFIGARSLIIKASLSILLSFLLVACVDFGDDDDDGSDSSSTPAATISGTAATGAAIVGTVNVYGSNGGSINDVLIGAGGAFTVDVSGLTAPFFIHASPADSAVEPQYSLAAGPGTVNVTPLTSITLFYANGGNDPAGLITTWPSNAATVSGNLPNAQAVVNANFVGTFVAVDSTLDIDFTTYDFFSTAFSIGDTFDQILDVINVSISGSTVSIDVDGTPYSFNELVDTSGIDIGGIGGDCDVTGVTTLAEFATIMTTECNTFESYISGDLIGNSVEYATSPGEIFEFTDASTGQATFNNTTYSFTWSVTADGFVKIDFTDFGFSDWWAITSGTATNGTIAAFTDEDSTTFTETIVPSSAGGSVSVDEIFTITETVTQDDREWVNGDTFTLYCGGDGNFITDGSGDITGYTSEVGDVFNFTDRVVFDVETNTFTIYWNDVGGSTGVYDPSTGAFSWSEGPYSDDTVAAGFSFEYTETLSGTFDSETNTFVATLTEETTGVWTATGATVQCTWASTLEGSL